MSTLILVLSVWGFTFENKKRDIVFYTMPRFLINKYKRLFYFASLPSFLA